MSGLSNELGTRFAGLDQTRGISVLPAASVRIHPSVDSDLVPAAVLLMSVVGLVLVLVCSNLAILLLLRGAAQHRDVSIRMAMGAGRGRIVRQFLTESLLLALAGGVVGAIGAQWLIAVVSSDRCAGTNGLMDAAIDYRVLAFVTMLSVHHRRRLWSGARVAGDWNRREPCAIGGAWDGQAARRASSTGWSEFQVALSLVLLAGTGLVIRSMMQMERVDIGFNRDGLTVVTTNAAQAGYQPLEWAPGLSGY